MLALVLCLTSASGAALPDIVLDSETTTGISPHAITFGAGSWVTATTQAGIRHGSSFLHDNDAHAANKWVRYTPSLPEDGWYRVYLWNPSDSSYANNAEVNLETADGSVRIYVNQRQDGGSWNLLGTFRFIQGTSGYLTIRSARTDAATVMGRVIADAVRFAKVEPEVIVDSSDPAGVTFTGVWNSSSNPPSINGEYYHDGNTGQNGVATRSVEFKPTIPVAGRYGVYLTWVAFTSNSPNVHVDVYHGGSLQPATFSINQRDPGYEWVYLGEFEFGAGATPNGRVVISNDFDSATGEVGGTVTIDAVRFARVPGSSEVIDQNDAGKFTSNGTWTGASFPGTNSPRRLSVSHESDGNPATKGNHTYTLSTTLSEAGLYDVYGWWPSTATASTKTPIELITASGTVSAGTFSQRVNGGQWTYLGTRLFSTGTTSGARIKNNGADGTVFADGIMFVKGEDQDQDGMPDSWEVANGLNPASAADASLDPDADGFTNLQEFRAGLDPNTAQILTLLSGNNQKGPAKATLVNRLQAKVTTGQAGSSGAPVVFTIAAGGGELSVDGIQWASAVTLLTDATGSAQVYWRLGKYGSTQNKVTATFGSTQSVEFSATSNDLVARWRLDEATGNVAGDSSGAGNNAAIYPGVPNIWSAAGSFDGSSALQFGGNHVGSSASSRITAFNLNHEIIPVTGKPFTISMWFKTDTLVAGRFYWLASNEIYLQGGFRLGVDAGLFQTGTTVPRLQFWTTQSGGTVFLRAQEEIKAGRWYHVSVTHDGTTTTLYLNRKQVEASNGTLLGGTTGLDIGAVSADAHEFAGKIDDIKVFSAVVPPTLEKETTIVASQTVDVAEDSRVLMNLAPASLNVSITQQPQHGTLRGQGSAWIYQPNDDYNGTDSFTYTTQENFGTPSQPKTVQVSLNVTSVDDVAEPQYQKTVVVDHGGTANIQLSYRNPDNHSVDILNVAVTPVKDRLGNNHTQTQFVQNLSDPTGASWTYTASNATNAIGQAILTYDLRDNVRNVTTSQKVYIHVVRPVYLSLGHPQGINISTIPDPGDPNVGQFAIPASSPTSPLLVSDPVVYYRLIAHPEMGWYCKFIYETGTYTTAGAYHSTAKPGCKHIGQSRLGTTIRQVGSFHPNQPGRIIFAADHNAEASGFEVRDMTLDSNPFSSEWLPVDDRLVYSAIACMGDNIIISNVRIVGFGTGRPGAECFPILLFPGEITPQRPAPFENLIVEDCLFEESLKGNRDGVSYVGIVSPAGRANIVNGVIRRCVLDMQEEAGFSYVQGAGAPLVEYCHIKGGGVSTTRAFYIEPKLHLPNQDFSHMEFHYRKNKLEGVQQGLRIAWDYGASLPSVVLEDNESIACNIIQPNPTNESQSYFVGWGVSDITFGSQNRAPSSNYSALKATFLGKLGLVGNTVIAAPGADVSKIWGLYVADICDDPDVVKPAPEDPNLVYKPLNIREVECFDNVLGPLVSKHFIASEPATPFLNSHRAAFESFFGNVSTEGLPTILSHPGAYPNVYPSTVQQPIYP